MKNELYVQMMRFKVEGWLTAKQWCEKIGKYYSPATFTALVKDGLITRSKTHKDSKGPYIYINMTPYEVAKENKKYKAKNI